jgi:hypothetical protein
VAAVWHLSNASFDRMPWIVYDFKRDELLAEVADLENEILENEPHITTEDLPTQPGIYFVHPHPDDVLRVQAQMWRIWEHQNMGVFVDEGYMVCSPTAPNPAFRSLLTQGRSLHIPMIILSQRPVCLDKFVFTESDFYQVFSLQSAKDRNKIMEYVPTDLDEPLPRHHSYYHDVAQAETHVMRPVPTGPKILKEFERRFLHMKPEKRRRVI